MLLRHGEHEARVLTHRGDLCPIADDARVHGQPVPELVRLGYKPRGLEAEKGLLEARPLRFDHAPRKSRGEHALGNFGQRAVVTKLRERLWLWPGRHELGKRSGAA